MAIVTGKPIPLGGSLGRKEATGRGVSLATRELLKREGRQLEETTVAVQGYGNVGMFAATILNLMGCKIIAVSDVSGGLYHPHGLDIANLNQHIAVHIEPDILANAGGVIVSYFEWVQDLQFFFWSEKEVNHNLERIMVQSFKDVWEFSHEQHVPLRLGAYMLAVDKVARAVRDRGIFP